MHTLTRRPSPLRAGMTTTIALSICVAWMAWGTPALAQQGPKKAFPAAPSFQAKTWVQGKATTLTQANHLYVVELWATWCKPCQESLPALARLQTTHTGKVTMIALTDDDEKQVRHFIKQRPVLAPLAVAVDPATMRRYMDHFKINGIPTALLIRNGKVMWLGHPAELRPVLERALKGTWTPTSQQEARALAAKAQQVSTYWRNGGVLTPKSRQEAAELAKLGKDYPMVLNNVAWLMLTETKPGKRPLDLALQLAEVANSSSEGKNFYILDTYARALYLKGNTGKATTLQQRALDLCTQAGEQCSELSQLLKHYQSGQPLK
ncbi:MAG: thioredoxin-like domain-containing protein [Myxococcota bacterium]